MNKITRSTAILLVLTLISLVPGVVAAAEPDAETEQKTEAKPESQEPEAQSSSTQHQIQIDGETVRYTATAGWLILENDEEEPIARFGYTAYTRDGFEDRSRRPILFAFNGGPGSSSIWLHMGILGPQRAVIEDEG